MRDSLPLEGTSADEDGHRRRFLIPAKRVPGLLLLLLLPLVALTGLTSLRGSAVAETEGMRLAIDYPRTLRYLKPTDMQVDVTNTGSTPLTGVVIALERDYFDAFTGLTLMPAETSVNESQLLLDAGDLAPGETGSVRIELRANRYWLHEGVIEARADGALVSAELGTLMLP